MELKEYWEIVVQRKWVVISLTVLALVASMVFALHFALSYKATTRLAVKPQNESRSTTYYSYDEYYAYVASEYLIDDVIELLESAAFRQDLREKLQGQIGEIPDKAIDAKKTHRVLVVNVTAGSEDQAILIAQTIGDLLTEPDSKYFARLSWQNPTVTIVDPPRVESLGEGRRALDLGLRTVLGLVAGICLAFMLDYLAGTLRGAGQVERIVGLRVLGEIPRDAGWRKRGTRPT